MPSGDLRLVFQRPDGGVSVDIPVLVQVGSDDEGRPVTGELAGAALAAHVARLEAAHGWVHVATTTAAELPGRRLRNAWRFEGGRVAVNVPAGRSLLVAEARAERDRRLAASDGPMLRAQEQDPGSVGAWRSYRQALRDVPGMVMLDLESLGFPEALEAYTVPWPAEPA